MEKFEGETLTIMCTEPPSNVGEFIAELRYSKEERDQFAKTIKDFNELYYAMMIQTWSNTYWRGVPIFKTPTDLWVYQELIEHIRPDLIIETGSCYGGSALFLRNMLDLIFPNGHVISIDIEPKHIVGKARVEGISYLYGSSVDEDIVAQVQKYITDAYALRVMVILDSDHSKEHVLKELALYAPLVTVGSALIVEDTNTEGPLAAVQEWRRQHSEFKGDHMCEKFMLTFSRDGYFERVAP